MSDWNNTGRPPAPDEARQTNSSSANEPGLVPFGSTSNEDETRESRHRSNTSSNKIAGPIVCAVGGMVSATSLYLFGPAITAVGFELAWEEGSTSNKVISTAAALAAALVMCFWVGWSSSLAGVVMSIMTIVASQMLCSGQMTPGRACVVIAITTLVHLVCDSLLAVASGTTLSESMEALIDAYAELLTSASSSSDLTSQIETSSAAESVVAALDVLWPMSYTLTAIGEYISARFGLWLAVGGSKQREEGSTVSLPKLAELDMPLWVVAVFIISIAVTVLELTISAISSDIVLIISANIAMGFRFAFLAQGIAVLAWMLSRQPMGCLSVFVVFLLLSLEMEFFVVTILGLVDVWANFRHLPRNDRPSIRGATQTD